jgi:hypothetical protein
MARSFSTICLGPWGRQGRLGAAQLVHEDITELIRLEVKRAAQQ